MPETSVDMASFVISTCIELEISVLSVVKKSQADLDPTSSTVKFLSLFDSTPFLGVIPDIS
jgi:hypothetical protein